MRRAFCLIRPQAPYRREAFLAGLAAAGLQLMPTFDRRRCEPGDVLVIWNRYGDYADCADACERAGGAVLVCENGYLGADRRGRQNYAIALHGHNGSGTWPGIGLPRPAGYSARWQLLELRRANWRKGGSHILVCDQRSIGSPRMASPAGWARAAALELARHTDRPIRVRPHPASSAVRDGLVSVAPLADDLRDAWAVVVWSSNCASHALLAGIPVFASAPHIVTEPAVNRGLERIERPLLGGRAEAFARLAWAQWSIEEITAGLPFRYLLGESA